MTGGWRPALVLAKNGWECRPTFFLCNLLQILQLLERDGVKATLIILILKKAQQFHLPIITFLSSTLLLFPIFWANVTTLVLFR